MGPYFVYPFIHCFPLLAIVNNEAVNTYLQAFESVLNSYGYRSQSRIALEELGSLLFTAPVPLPTSNVWRFWFRHHSFLKTFFVSTGVWTWGLALVRQMLYCSSHAWAFFQIGSHFYSWTGLEGDFSFFILPLQLGWQALATHTLLLLVEMRPCGLFAWTSLKLRSCQAPVAHTCNPSYSGGEIRRIVVQSQPEQIVHKPPSWKNPTQKRAGRVAQAVRDPA
jgi:hypothetical protein